MKKSSLLIALVLAFSIVLHAAPPTPTPTPKQTPTVIIDDNASDYVALESAARKSLAAALIKNDTKSMDICVKSLESIAKARYLCSVAQVNETFQETFGEFVDQFKPQLVTLPTIIRSGGAMALTQNKQLFPAFAQAAAQWLSATNTAAAKDALQDAAGLFKAQEEYDKTYSTALYAPGKTDESMADREVRAQKAATEKAVAMLVTLKPKTEK